MQNATALDQHVLIGAVPDEIALEHSLSRHYDNREMAALLRKIVRERDAPVAKQNETRAKCGTCQENKDQTDEERIVGENNDNFSERRPQ